MFAVDSTEDFRFILIPHFLGAATMKSLFIFILLVLLLFACGQKGDLILPDEVPGSDESEVR